jgi:O-acetylserine/cysteine efflux transporter
MSKGRASRLVPTGGVCYGGILMTYDRHKRMFQGKAARGMRFRDMALAALTSVIWGFGFVVIKFGLESFSASQLTALRFMIACVPIILVPRPKVPWSSIVLIGMTLFTGQFLLLFFAFTQGMPAGLASVTQQLQAFFTVLLAALFLRDIPDLRQCTGMTIAFAGLALIGWTAGLDLKMTALGLAVAAAMSWAVGNILVKRIPDVPVFPLMVWSSLVPPLPALIVSGVYDEGAPFLQAIAGAAWPSIAAVLYLGILSTTVAYGMWGYLLQRYSAAVVAPFALLSPCTGVLASALIFGEVFEPLRYAGMALILAGLAVVVLPAGWTRMFTPFKRER